MPASPFSLTFDAETTTDAGQALRFGAYQFRKGDKIIEAGIFYDRDSISADELAVLQSHAEANGLTLRTRDKFADEVFFKLAYQLRATIIGFNLPFDISRLAVRHGSALTRIGTYFGGRSVRIRRQTRQVILCDFLSMYPTVCTLMGLWRFVIAEGMIPTCGDPDL